MKKNRIIITLPTIFALLLFFTPHSESRIYNYNIFEVSLSFGLPADLQNALDLNSNDDLEDEEPFNDTPAAFRSTRFHIYHPILSVSSENFLTSIITIYSGLSQRSPPFFFND